MRSDWEMNDLQKEFELALNELEQPGRGATSKKKSVGKCTCLGKSGSYIHILPRRKRSRSLTLPVSFRRTLVQSEIGGPNTDHQFIDPRVNISIQRALMTMSRSADPAEREEAFSIIAAVKAGRLQGLYEWDQEKPAQLAKRNGRQSFLELLPDGVNSALLCEGLVPSAPPMFIYRAPLEKPVLITEIRNTISPWLADIADPAFCEKQINPPPDKKEPIIQPIDFTIPQNIVPIFVIPGIMASRLEDPITRKAIWDPKAIPPIVDIGRLRNLDQNRINEKNTDLEPITSVRVPIGSGSDIIYRILAERITNFGNLIPEFYDQLMFSLDKPSSNPKVRTQVIAFGYDWRLDNAITAKRLHEYIQEHMSKLQAKKCIIVAHSMGGLISRFMFKNFDKGKQVHSLILLASPAIGAPESYSILKDGVAKGLLGFLFHVFKLMSPNEFKKMVRQFPSIYQLLPWQAYCNTDPQWATFSIGGSPVVANNAVNFYKDKWLCCTNTKALL